MCAMDPAHLDGRTLALLITTTAADGESESAVMAGTLIWQEPDLLFERLHAAPVRIKPEWLRRIREADDDEDLLGAELVLELIR